MPLIRSSDKKGAYYCWGAAGSRHRYAVGDRASRDRAKSRAGPRRSVESVLKTAKRGGATPRKARPKTISTAARAKQKMADISIVKKTADYRRMSTARKRS
jgi:hypothetical protein